MRGRRKRRADEIGSPRLLLLCHQASLRASSKAGEYAQTLPLSEAIYEQIAYVDAYTMLGFLTTMESESAALKVLLEVLPVYICVADSYEH
jgi:hypothetical protein